VSNRSNVITVDERLQLPAPDTLGSISLNRAIHLGWADNAAQSTRFKWYRVYSASYNLDTGLCGTDWVLEGTTVSNEFLATLLTNGTPRCFGASAISTEGYESLWSPLRQDTPRPDARNVLVYAFQANADSSGFRFWSDVNSDGIGQPSELGLIQNGSRTDIDFVIHRHADSTLWVVPVFSARACGSTARARSPISRRSTSRRRADTPAIRCSPDRASVMSSRSWTARCCTTVRCG